MFLPVVYETTARPQFSAASISAIFGITLFFCWSRLLVELISELMWFLDKLSVTAMFLWNPLLVST